MNTSDSGGIVVPFPPRAGSGVDTKERMARNRDHLAKMREAETAKLRRIEKDRRTGKKGPIFGKLNDRLAAARANGELVEKAKRKGKSITEIEEEFGGRSDRYRLALGADISSKEARRNTDQRLMQQVQGYLKLAEAVARLVGENADDFKIGVLRHTSLWSSRHEENYGDLRTEQAEELDLLIHEMCRHVIQKEKLVELFRELRQVPGTWTDEDPARREFNRADTPCLYLERYINGFSDYNFSNDPLPGVRLGRLPAAEADVFVRFADPEPWIRDESVSKCNPLHLIAATDERVRAGASVGFTGTLRLFREIRLVIGPATGAERIEPMFESRGYCDLIANGKDGTRRDYCLRRGWTLEVGHATEIHDDDRVRLGIGEEGLWAEHYLRQRGNDGGQWERVYLEFSSRARLTGEMFEPSTFDNSMPGMALFPLYWRRSPGTGITASGADDDHDAGFRRYWEKVWRLPIDADHILHLLDHPGRVQSARTGGLREPPDEYWFPWGTLAHQVEHMLRTGRLEQALLKDTAYIRRAFEERTREWRASVQAQTAHLLAEWSAAEPEADGT